MGIKRMPLTLMSPQISCLVLRLTDFFPSELFQVISDNAPDAIKQGDIKQHFGRKVAIDAYVFYTLLQEGGKGGGCS